MNWDQDHFYLTAKITDDIHFTSASEGDIWKNDSVQFAAMAGMPGELMGWYEFGLSQTPQGPQIYRWRSADYSDKSLVANGSLQVTRDEAKKVTVYELALPWSELTPIRPAKNDAISFSLLVNDNDGAGRKGYIEWGSGIGDVKDSKKFRTVQWVGMDETPPTTTAVLEGTRRNGWYVSGVTASLSAADDKTGVAETVYSLDGGIAWQPYTKPLIFDNDGQYTLHFRSTDRAGNEEQPQTVAFAIDQTAPEVAIHGGGTYTTDQTVTVTCTATDTVSGVVYSSCALPLVNSPAYLLDIGDHAVTASATDAAGNVGTATATVTVKVTVDSLIRLIEAWVTGSGSQGIVNALQTKLQHGQFDAFKNQVNAQRGKKIPEEAADILLRLVEALR